jgi:hypothetical protein
MFKVNDKVGRGACVLSRARDYWCSQGREPMKSGAKAALDKAIADRGVVTKLLLPDASRGVSPGVEVTWVDGTISRSLDYMVRHVD